MPILTSYQLHTDLQDELPEWVKRVADALTNLNQVIHTQIPFARQDSETPAAYFERLSTHFYQLLSLDRKYFAAAPEDTQLEFAEDMLNLSQAVEDILKELKESESPRTQEVLQSLLQEQAGAFEAFEGRLPDPPSMDQVLALIRELRKLLSQINLNLSECNDSLEMQLSELSNKGLMFSLKIAEALSRKRKKRAGLYKPN